MEYVVDSLIDFSGSQDEELRDIAGLGSSDCLAKDLEIFLRQVNPQR
jgi:hypothetical protein